MGINRKCRGLARYHKSSNIETVTNSTHSSWHPHSNLYHLPEGNFGGSNKVSISVSQFPSPGISGVMGPIGNQPVPPRIVQEAGLPSQALNVNQDPATWRIVESAGLVGTYDIIDNRGNVVQLGFRTLRDAETYLNYFISYYKWVQSGSTGIPGPVPVGGGTIGGIGGIGGGTGFGGIGTGGITATAGNVMASAGMGGAFASAGNALAQAFAGGTGGTGKMLGPTPVPEEPFEAIPRAQGPFRSGQDNQEPIYDNSGIKIGADFGSPGETVNIEDVTGEGGRRRRKSRLDLIRARTATAIARAGDISDLRAAIVDVITSAFGDIMLSLTVNSMLDGNSIHKNQQRFALRKVSVFT